jgi:putative transposase
VLSPTRQYGHQPLLVLSAIRNDMDFQPFHSIFNLYTEPVPKFFTATILDWSPLLDDNANKDIIIKSLMYLSEKEKVKVYGLVIMPNHIHLIWKIPETFKPEDIQRDFLKFTAQQFKFRLKDHRSEFLENFKVNAKDREYQFWERNALSVDLLGENMLLEKLAYIHANPIREKWHLATSEKLISIHQLDSMKRVWIILVF